MKASSGKDNNRNRVNRAIRAEKLRLIDDQGKQVGVVSTKEALKLAKEAGLDLVEIQPNSEPPVAKIMDYGKFAYQRDKQKSAAKKKQTVVKVKEIKFRPTTDTNDFEVKLSNLRRFLEGGNKVKVTVWFRGREMTHHQLGMALLERIRDALEELGKVEFFPTKLEGRQLVMVLAPKKK